MKTKQSIQKNIIGNTFWLFVSEFFNRGVVFILAAISANILGVDEFGKLTSALALVGIFSIITDYGTSTYFIKEVSKNTNEKNNYMFHILFLRIFLIVIFFILLTVTVSMLKYEAEYSYVVYLAYFYTILLSLTTFLRAAFKVSNAMKIDAVSSAVSGSLAITIVLALLYTSPTLPSLLMGYIISSIVALVVTVILIKRIHAFHYLKINRRRIKEIVVGSSPYILSALCIYVYYYSDQILLFNLQGPTPAGEYAAAYKILSLLIAPIGLFLIVLLPIFSNHFHDKKISSTIRDTIKTNILLVFLGSTVTFLALFFSADNIIELIYGSEFEGAGTILKLLLVSWYILVNYSIAVIALQAFDQQHTYVKITFFGAVLNIALNLYFIPLYSGVGAAITTIITEIVIGSLVSLIFIKRIWLKK
jgi:PST family polysaccharide transporter